MTALDSLTGDFQDALNQELAALGCALRIAKTKSAGRRTMVILQADGSSLGLVPDHTDAPTIAAFERIVSQFAADARMTGRA